VKIGLVNLSEFVGGAERELLDHATALQDDYGVAVVAIIDSRNTEFAAMLGKCAIPVQPLHFRIARVRGVAARSPGNLWRTIRQTRALRTIQRRCGLDLLVTYSFQSGVVGALARLSGMKTKLVIGQLTRRDLTRGGYMEHLQFLAADGVTYNSNALRRSYANVARRYPRPEKIVYSYVKKPVLESNHKARERLFAEHGLMPGTTIVGVSGRIFKDKRVADVVEAVSLLNAATPGKFFFVAMGGSADPAEYEMEVKALAAAKCAGQHRFFPFLSDPFPLMAAFDVVVMPSVEPFGRVLVEAMYLGVPFVATDAGGPKEIMAYADPRCGKLVPPMRPDLIADAIVAVIKNRPADYPQVPYPLTRDGIVGGAVDFYQEILAGGRAARKQVREIGLLRGDQADG
jgi:glycosyltransferase involved in cell wall biosynthesis